MTWVTEMCIAPAKPNSHVTTKLAFKFNVVCSVNFAFSYATSNIDRIALGTHKLFFVLIINIKLSSFSAILPPNKVSILTLETLIV